MHARGPVVPQAALAATLANATGTLPGGQPAAPASTVAAQLAPLAAGNPQAASTATVPAATIPAPPPPVHVDARGNPMLAGGPAQGREGGAAQAHGHTVAAAGRRSRLGDGPSGRGNRTRHALALLGLGREKPGETAREQADRVFGRLYWLLTAAAWISAAAMVVVVALPMFDGFSGASPQPGRNPLAWIGVLGTLGLVAGVGAWWLARRQR